MQTNVVLGVAERPCLRNAMEDVYFHNVNEHYMKSSSLSSCAALSSNASSVNRFSYRFDFFWSAHSFFCRAASLA